MRPTPEACVTCGDVALPARVVEVTGMQALVAAGDETQRVAIDLVPDARPGELLLCHAGVALERIERAAT